MSSERLVVSPQASVSLVPKQTPQSADDPCRLVSRAPPSAPKRRDGSRSSRGPHTSLHGNLFSPLLAMAQHRLMLNCRGCNQPIELDDAVVVARPGKGWA